MALGTLGAAAAAATVVELVSEGGKRVISDMVGKAAGAAGKVVEKKVMESLGGKGVIDDEIAYEELETNLTVEERLILKEFRDMKRSSFGSDTKDKEAFKDWDNDFRQVVLKKRILGKSKSSPKTVKKKDGTVTTTEDEKSTPGNNKPAIDFLKRFAAHIKIERNKRKTRVKKREAGFRAGQAYLDNYNLPSDRPSAFGQQVKEAAASIPGAVTTAKDKVAAALPVVKSAGVVAATTVGEVAKTGYDRFLEHSNINNYNERKKTRPGIAGWFSKFLG